MYQKLADILSGRENNFMLPFYWQHGDHHETIPEEVERIYRSGCRALCVESRPHPDFVGPDWWRDMDLILAEAKKRDMKVWILDDDHFPTGHAAGHIEKYHPEKRRWDIAERHVDVLGPVENALLITREDEQSRLLGIYAYRRTGENEGCDGDTMLDLSGQWDDRFVQLTLPEGMWRVYFLYKTRNYTHNSDYVDLLTAESVRVLIDAVYEPHYEHYREYFGDTIAGFFSDEPQLANSWFGPHAEDPGIYRHGLGLFGMAYPWNPEVTARMEKALGFDPMPWMAAIWQDLGEITPKIRHAYMDAWTRVYRDNFTRQLGKWCADHGVEYIGHVIEDMGTHARTGCGNGHYFRALDGQHMSGIDIVLHQLMPGMSGYIHTCSTHGNNADPGFFDYILCKLAPSLARISTQMKGRAMCEVFGAYGWAEKGSDMKWLLDHLLVRGVNHFVPHAFSPQFPDPDCPPHFGANGKDPQYDAFSRLMTYGNKVTHLLYGTQPVCDCALLYTAECEWMRKEDDTFLMNEPARALYDANLDFDILPMDVILGDRECTFFPAEAENGLLKVGPNRYKALVIPAVSHLPEEVEKKLEDLRTKGIPVFWVGRDAEAEELPARLSALFTPDIRIEGQREFLRTCHHRDGDTDIYMFVNESTVREARCTATLNGIGDREGLVLDLLNDRICPVTAKDGTVPVELAPNQSFLLIFGDVEPGRFSEARNWTKREPVKLTFSMETASWEDLTHFRPFADEVSADALPCVTDLKHMPDFSGTVRYTARFTAGEKAVLGLDLGRTDDAVRLYLNGRDLGIRLTAPYVYDLTGKLREGENVLVIECSNTLANSVRDYFSGFMTIPGAGLRGGISWLYEHKEET